ncbi:hypothetical protein GCM10007887_25290 [Methylobacterium haplocladii]|nr:hypothetical protein GCM10007887_25290 [Methylobacterium haplocladii]
MAYRVPITCEVQIDSEWRNMSAIEAHIAHRNASKRCPDCYGAMISLGSYMGARKATLQHRRGHDGCPRLPLRYSGTPTRHPEALA